MSRFGAGAGPPSAVGAPESTTSSERTDFLHLCSPETRVVRVEAGLDLESGRRLDGFDVAYRTWGSPRESATLVCHALTGSADVDDWWPGLLAEGGPLDPNERFVVCSNVLGGCYGSEGPSSRVAEDGRLLGSSFPALSIRDLVRVQALWLDAIGVERLDLVVGGSMGGMQVLEWAALFPDRVGAIVPVATSARHSAWCIGISEAQRRAITADPKWRDGRYRPSERPVAGLAVARQVAMVSYRSFESFGRRFDRDTAATGGFAVADYLDHHGRSLVERFDPSSYVALTHTMDSHDLGRDRGSVERVLGSIGQPALVLGVSSDVLYPLAEQRDLAAGLGDASLEVIESPHGHDGFLIEQEQVAGAIAAFLEQRVPPAP